MHSIKKAAQVDNVDLCEVVAKAPMEGSIRLAQDRRPNYFHGAAVQCELPEIFVSQQPDRSGLAGIFAAGSRRVYVNGKIQPLRYLSDLRIAPDHRGSTLLARGFRFLRNEILTEGEFAQTLVISENEQALSLLTSRRQGLPQYFPCGQYDYSLISLHRPHLDADPFMVRGATVRDIPTMQAFFNREAPRKQFFPAYDFTEIGRSNYFRDATLEDFFLAFENDVLVGILGAWDQSNYKKTQVLGYQGGLRLLRPWLNAAQKLRGGIELPAPGTLHRTLYLHCAVCRDNDANILTALIQAIQRRFEGQKYDHAALGLDQRDSLREALKRFRTLSFAGHHFLVSFGVDPRPNLDDKAFYFEAARI